MEDYMVTKQSGNVSKRNIKQKNLRRWKGF